jgi:hypothetical protein
MLSEALELLQATAVDAADARIIGLPLEPRKYLVQHGDNLEYRDIPPPLRNHKVGSVEDLIQLAKDLDVGGNEEQKSIVWHSYCKAVLVVDGNDRRDLATLPLEYGDQFKTLSNLEQKGWIVQRDLIQLLRVDLKGCITLSNLIENLRKIKFRVSSAGDANVQHGNESLGKSVEAEVSGTDVIPEDVIVNVKVYKNLGETERFPVCCALDIDPHEQKFRFRPMADELEVAKQQAQESIRRRLNLGVPEGVNVYFGEP